MAISSPILDNPISIANVSSDGVRPDYAHTIKAARGLSLSAGISGKGSKKYFFNNKPYSIGRLTSDRDDLATMVDSDGTIKWCPHNLLEDSGSMSANLYDDWHSFGAPSALYEDGGTVDGVAADLVYPSAQFIAVYDFSNSSFIQTGSAWTNWISDGVVSITFTAPAGCTEVYVYPTRNGLSTPYTRQLISATPGLTYTFEFNVVAAGENYLASKYRCYRSDLGGMMSNPDTGDSYVPTSGSARFLGRAGHHVWNGSEWIKTAMLVEPERTNLVVNSTITDANWTSQNSTITDGVGDGFSRLLENNNSSSHLMYGSGVSFTSGTTYTLSWEVKQVNDGHAQITLPSSAFGTGQYANINLSTGAVVVQVGGVASVRPGQESGSWLVSFTATATSSDTGAPGVILISNPATAGRAQAYAGDETRGVDVRNVQLEVGGYPTTLIPTNGSTVTRSADTFEIPATLCPDFGSIAIRGFISYDDLGIDRQEYIISRAADVENFFELSLTTVATFTGRLDARVHASNVQYSALSTAGANAIQLTPDHNIPFAVAMVTNSDRTALVVNGTYITQNATDKTVPDLSSIPLRFGARNRSAIAITEILIFEDDIGDTALEEISS